jgi:hypothetical protein
MSIYVQIATIEDDSITSTVMSAYETAKNPGDLYIGIAATVGQHFYDEKISPLRVLPNVSVKKFDPITDRGLGKGRVNSRFAYTDQDYILQIDAHTLFQNNWDRFIPVVLERAIRETGNKKTLITGYLGSYGENNGTPSVIDNWSGYSAWSERNVTDRVPLKNVSVARIKDIPDEVVFDRSGIFYPSNRVAGNFIFGNKSWAEYHGWSGEETFWEEEVLPAISLLDQGFSLVFPNMPLPLTHRYREEDPKRQVMDDMFQNINEINNLAISYIGRFVNENWDACEKYREYSGYSLATNTLTHNVYIPERYEF